MENGKLAGTESLESIESSSTNSVISTRAVPNITGNEPVRTLFVSGLPMDAKQRELYLLFRSCRGYENSLLRITQSKDGGIASPVGFVTFSSAEDAEIAMKALQSALFDPITGHKIRLEKAKSNTKVAKPKQISPPLAVLPPPTSVNPAAFPPGMLQAAAAAVAASAAPPPQSVFAPPPPPPAIAAPTSHRQDLISAACLNDSQLAHILNENHFLLNSVPQFAAAAAAAAAAASQPPFLLPPAAAAIAAGLPLPPIAAANVSSTPFLQPNAAVAQLTAATQHVTAAQLNAVAVTSANAAAAAAAAAAKATATVSPACSTLFVANLGDGVTEDELKAVFCAYPGFTRLRLHTRNDTTVAFVEFRDVRQATLVMNALQGCRISSSHRGGIRIEYARNRMGDITGQCFRRMEH
ncbi:RNA binding protein, putative [Brugia malayi]|uniref:BMA-MEC-8, isoform c n=1 Tax=Brugia malayi TaxID=6279 RepID=A0A0J9YAV7_BRUMA|nr:RNA binding protein, putative [Brugia malayi]CDQ05193.1 BMA-MEC-8, isoform c [Brugia malayi]VIO95283.1 RNA binding protein, putative [Brugia malayi]